MADLTQEEFLALAHNARVQILDEDLEHLNWRFNALMEALDDVLDRHPLDQVLARPTRPHPVELPTLPTRSTPAHPLPTESDAPLAHKSTGEMAHLIRTKRVSPVELVELYLERIGEHDGTLMAD